MIKFKKVDMGHYEIIRNGQVIGEVIKLTEKEWKAFGDHGCYFFKTRSGAADILSRVTPEETAAAAPQPKESTYTKMTAEDHWAAEITADLNKKICEKIKPVFEEPAVSPFRIGCSSGSWELKGSKRLDFMEFMYIYSDGSVICNRSFDQLCEAYAADDECGPDSHADNFADCWGDYLRAWQKANSDQLCSCCNGEGSVKGSETENSIRMITCPECKGDGLQVDQKEQEIQELIQITQDQGVKGEELQEIISWLRSVEQRTVRAYLEAARKDPTFIQPKEDRDEQSPEERLQELEELVNNEETPIHMKNLYHDQIMYLRRNLSLSSDAQKDPECDLCGGSGRVADDILCWRCEQPLDVSNPFEDLRDYSEELEVRYSLQTALMDMKECGETRVAKDPILEQMVILELLEMGISVIKYDLDGVTVIQQDFD